MIFSSSSNSKKNLPLPPALPLPLKAFLLNAPVVPPTGAAPSSAPAPHAAGAHPPVHPAAAPPAQDTPKKASISSAFDFESPAQSMPLPSVPGGTVPAAAAPGGVAGASPTNFGPAGGSDVSFEA